MFKNLHHLRKKVCDDVLMHKKNCNNYDAKTFFVYDVMNNN